MAALNASLAADEEQHADVAADDDPRPSSGGLSNMLHSSWQVPSPSSLPQPRQEVRWRIKMCWICPPPSGMYKVAGQMLFLFA